MMRNRTGIAISIVVLINAGCTDRSGALRYVEGQLLNRNGDLSVLVEPFSLTPSKGGYIFADTKAPVLYRFDMSFRLLGEIGRLGQGPGEYIAPWKVRQLGQSRLIVIDPANIRLTVLDSLFQLETQWRIEYGNRRMLDARTGPNGHIYVSQYREPDAIFSVYLDDGTQLGKFGEWPTEYVDALRIRANLCTFSFIKKRLYVAFSFFPLIRVYSLSGDLIEEHIWSSDTVRLLESELGDLFDMAETRRQRYTLVSASDAADDSVLVLSGFRDMESCAVYVFDRRCNLVDEIIVRLPSNTDQRFFDDMIISPHDGMLYGLLQVDSGIVRVNWRNTP